MTEAEREALCWECACMYWVKDIFRKDKPVRPFMARRVHQTYCSLRAMVRLLKVVREGIGADLHFIGLPCARN